MVYTVFIPDDSLWEFLSTEVNNTQTLQLASEITLLKFSPYRDGLDVPRYNQDGPKLEHLPN